jgi:hypothetical protein
MKATALQSAPYGRAAKKGQTPSTGRPFIPSWGRSLSGNDSPAIRPASACACGGGCPRCETAGASVLPIGDPGDRHEQEADHAAEHIMRMPDCETRPSLGLPHVGAKPDRSSLSNLNPPAGASGTALPVVHEVLSSPGQPLDAGVRAVFEPRFRRDFSNVRVHADGRAAQSARALNAYAYTFGSHIAFGAGRYRPFTEEGQTLIAHELTHVVQGKEAGTQNNADPAGASTIRRYADPTAAATYPTAAERSDIQEILNPQQHAAAQAGGAVDPVSDRAGFQTAMVARLDPYIDKVLVGAQQREASSIVLGMPEIQGLGDIAQHEIHDFYGTYLTAAAHSKDEQARLAGYQLRAHLHEVPSALSADTDNAAKNWVASRMRAEGGDLLESFHVLSGKDDARDQALFESVRDFIFSRRTADLRKIILFHPGYEVRNTGEVYIQPRIPPSPVSKDADVTRRLGRWTALGTTLHEMLHAVAHEKFKEGVEGLEASGIAVEGFAEYFTRPVYERLSQRAVNETALRTSIEGTNEAFINPPDRKQYQPYVDAVGQVRDILGGNEENLKVAYFMGRMEYLGLGGWNEAGTASRFPGNTLGVAALVTDNGQGYFRVQYTRVVLGRGGAFQINLGGTVGYLTQNQRLSLGGSGYLQYSWPNLYVRGGVDVTGSAPFRGPFSDTVRLDVMPGVEAGFSVGVVRAGANANLIVPVTGGPISDRTVRLAAGVGLSLIF